MCIYLSHEHKWYSNSFKKVEIVTFEIFDKIRDIILEFIFSPAQSTSNVEIANCYKIWPRLKFRLSKQTILTITPGGFLSSLNKMLEKRIVKTDADSVR